MFLNCALTSFEAATHSLVNGEYMFIDCNSLSSFKGSLQSLLGGHYMFYGCKLDLESVQCIANTINDVKNITYSSDF